MYTMYAGAESLWEIEKQSFLSDTAAVLYTQLLNRMLTNELQCRADNNLMKYEMYEHIHPSSNLKQTQGGT